MPKSAQAFRTISEAAEAVGAPQHVLRFWETKFPFVVPVKRAGGRRFYRPHDIVILKAIRRLLHEEGLTIKGVQKLHREQGLAAIAAHGDPDADFTLDPAGRDVTGPGASGTNGGVGPADRERLLMVLQQLEAAKGRLDAVLTA